ncbi:MAG: hypothetical protein WDN25_29980 [Acetobacteraceae bacterium]
MNAPAAIALIDVGELLAVAAPGINPWFRHVVGLAMVNPHTTPDALFCLADALEELIGHISLTAEPLPIFTPHVRGLRTLAGIARERAAQLAAA